MNKFDVIVVGAGTAGCMAARTAAKAGLSVCLIDYKRADSIGDKVCGDAIGKHHFDNLGLAYPKGDELERTIMGIEVYSPDMETVFKLSGEGLYGFIVDRRLFGQRLLKEAMDAGAMLLDSTQVIEPIIEDGFVRGVVARDRKTNGKKKILGSVTIDASGCSAVIRRRLPPEMGIETTIDKRDEVICYREIRILKNELEEPEYCKIYLNVNIAPGGYYWIFPKRGSKVNVGLGVAALANFPNPKDQLYKFVLSGEIFKNSIFIHGGGGIVPTRRPLDSFVSNGVVVIGDAACNVNPIHGGGIGPSMMAGKISGEVIPDVLETGEPTVEKLWLINIRYMKTYGAKQAGLDVFRLFLQSLSNEDINYGMKYKIIREDDVLKAGIEGDVRLNITDATRRLFMGLGRVSFLRKLYKMAKKSRALKKIYEEYPLSPKNMPEWKLKIKSIWEN
ncbi:MAG: NAD(P)/FAD-dependent oxidoreductase [Candidatus Bathyarchaeia archaeon]|nr:NAD(P)/FAD-dependent oxidoreductase [Candidatus Bathyarchaeota archaeon]